MKKSLWIGNYFCPHCGVTKYNFISWEIKDPGIVEDPDDPIFGPDARARAVPFGYWNYCPKCGYKNIIDIKGEE